MSADDVLAQIDGAIEDYDSPDAMRWVPPEARTDDLRPPERTLEDVAEAAWWDSTVRHAERPDTYLLAPAGAQVTAFIGPIGGDPADMAPLPVRNVTWEPTLQLVQDDPPDPLFAADGRIMVRRPDGEHAVSFDISAAGPLIDGMQQLTGSFQLVGEVARQVARNLQESMLQMLLTGHTHVEVLHPPRHGRSALARDIARAFDVPCEVVGEPCPSDGVCACPTGEPAPLSAAERALQARRARNTGPARPPASRQRRPRTHR